MSYLPPAKKASKTAMPPMPSYGNRPMPTQQGKNLGPIGSMSPAGRAGRVTVGGSRKR